MCVLAIFHGAFNTFVKKNAKPFLPMTMLVMCPIQSLHTLHLCMPQTPAIQVDRNYVDSQINYSQKSE